MRNLFDVFLELLEKLKDRDILSDWEEDYQNLSFTVQDSYGYFKELFSDESYRAELNASRISFKFCIEEQIFRNGQFYEFDFFEKEQSTQLTIALNKAGGFNIGKNEVVFLSKDSFIKHFEITRRKCTSFFEKLDFGKYIHIYLPIDKIFGNNYMKILPLKEFGKSPVEDLDEKIYENVKSVQKKREEYTRLGEFYPIPTVFDIRIEDTELLRLFDFNLFFTCLLHIANKFTERKFLIRGQKNVELSYETTSVFKHAKELHNIYCFTYKLEKFVQDKLEIVRNVISLYCQSEDDLRALDIQLTKIEATANRYFNAYISDEVKSFLKDTKEAIELAHKHAIGAHESADKIMTNINTAIIAIVTAVFTAVVTMSKGDILFLIVALGLHAFYFCISYWYNKSFVIQKKKDILNMYEISSEKVPVVSEEEREEIKDSILKPAIQNIDNNLKKYKTLTIRSVIGIVILASVLSGILIYLNSVKKAQPSNPKERILIIYADSPSQKNSFTI
ncbi:hypothetical protein bcgnr5378_02780 [Bacillus cereus]|nr:hypothetical protein [Bacillus pacificus]MDQ4482234.1 hypothetical protein [Bacillus cereus]MCC2350386.1 hypothetical protein [Bacillus pacificus]MCC2467734.1 hypothetical protein [Bacillus pacificus]MDR4260615.1 hypothetical protein [Bacillus pacificus]ONG61895.1 hypothetical protein BKK44_29720 [Bacillus cereus]